MICDFQSSLGPESRWRVEAEIDVIGRKPRDTLLGFAPKITTLNGHVFCWKIEKKVIFTLR